MLPTFAGVGAARTMRKGGALRAAVSPVSPRYRVMIALAIAIVFAAPPVFAYPAISAAPPADSLGISGSTESGSLIARRRRRKKRRKKKKRKKKKELRRESRSAVKQPSQLSGESSFPGSDKGSAREGAAPPPASGELRRGARVEFDGRLVQGQTAKSGAIYLFARKRSELRSMVEERKDYRKELLRTIYPTYE